MTTKTKTVPATSLDNAQPAAPRGMRIKTKIRAGGNGKGGTYYGNK